MIMAATKIHLIKTILRKIIDDVCNGDKTDDKIYITDTPVQRRKTLIFQRIITSIGKISWKEMLKEIRKTMLNLKVWVLK